jgi:hypothetical protein
MSANEDSLTAVSLSLNTMARVFDWLRMMRKGNKKRRKGRQFASCSARGSVQPRGNYTKAHLRSNFTTLRRAFASNASKSSRTDGMILRLAVRINT